MGFQRANRICAPWPIPDDGPARSLHPWNLSLLVPLPEFLVDPGRTAIILLAVALIIWRVQLSRESRQTKIARKRYESLFENNGDPVATLDAQGAIERVNLAFCELTGYDEKEVRGVSFASLTGASDRGRVSETLKRAIDGEPQNIETVLLSKGRQDVPAELITVPIVVSKSTVGTYQIVRDITLQKELERELTRALHDHLTGVANRDLFFDRLGHAIHRGQRRGEQVGLLYLDLDGFKSINDSAGHSVGDEVLRDVAARLRSLVRDEDTVARVGGDEFAIVLEDVAEEDGAIVVAQRAAELLSEPFRTNGGSFTVGASVGLAISSPDTTGPEQLVRQADVAMYEAKRRGGNQHKVYGSELETARTESLKHLEGDLKRALERQELQVHYQPIVDIAGSSIVGVEALARWQHPEHGPVSPTSFIPLAEESGLVGQLDLWVLERACQDVRRLMDAGLIKRDSFLLSANLSDRHLADDDLVDNVAGVLTRTLFRAQDLQLEISEDVAKGARERIADLKSLGLRVTIHDFGTGYSSLGYLKRVDIDGLKVDRSFVLPIGVDQASGAIVRSSLWLAQMLGLEITVVGVEEPAQLARLKELGGRLVQGFYFSKPVDLDALENLLAEGVPQAWIWRPGPEQRRKNALEQADAAC
jgi:diguanylate cyclase (GGDEF)-like protein/PAS domain S-box-containing protein